MKISQRAQKRNLLSSLVDAQCIYIEDMNGTEQQALIVKMLLLYEIIIKLSPLVKAHNSKVVVSDECFFFSYTIKTNGKIL